MSTPRSLIAQISNTGVQVPNCP